MKSLLITGLPRSGTTWAGEIARRVTSAAYFLEPFTPANGRIWFYRPDEEHWWVPEVQDELSRQRLRAGLEMVLERRLPFSTSIFLKLGWRDRARYARDILRAKTYRLRQRDVIVKDPNLSLAVEEFCAVAPSASVVFLIRHPAAFVSSCLLLNWKIAESLTRRHPILRSSADDQKGLAISWARFWRLIVTRGVQASAHYPQIDIVRHESASQNPLEFAQKLAGHFNVRWGAALEEKLQPLIYGRAGADAQTVVGMKLNSLAAIARDSRRNLDAWRERLPEHTLRAIWCEVRDTAKSLGYTESGLS